MSDVVYRDDPNLPPVNLPSFGAPPPVPHIYIGKQPEAGPGKTETVAPAKPEDDFPAYVPPAPVAPVKGAAKAAPSDQDFPEYAPPPPAAPRAPPRAQTGMEAAGRGAASAMTLGFAPALAGLAEASGIPSANPKPEEFDPSPIRPLIGAYKLIDDWVAGHKNPEVTAAYERGRQNYLGEQKQGEEQFPHAYLGGQLAGALMIPMGAGGTAASAAGRIGRTILAGGITGGTQATGEQVSQGKFDEIPKEALKGAATGAAFGGVGGTGAEVAGKVAGQVARVVRGKLDTEGEAASRVVGGLTQDFERRGGVPAISPEEQAAARRAGTDIRIVDTGGEGTRATARVAANISPQARENLTEFAQGRFHGQAERIGRRIRSFIGGRNAADDLDYIKTIARRQNAPAYKRAYAAGAAGHWSPKLEELMSSPAMQTSMQNAVQRGRNKAVAEGFSGYAPKIKLDASGKPILGPGNIPDMQFWDYTQRELRDMIDGLKRSGAFEEAGALTGIHKRLLAELDRLNPAFGAARGQAAKFFKAGDALEAGENFVREDINLQHAAKILAGMNVAERELFRRGFASELADQVEKTGFNRDVLNSIFVNNGPARQKILLAMGGKDARELEALLRVEAIVDQARKALGNSTTARQAAEMLGAGTAVGTIEALKEGDVNPVHFLAAAFGYHALKKGAHVIDEKVARRVSEMLLSNDPAVLARGYKIVTNSPAFFEALRHATASVARVGAQDIGPEKAAAGAATGLHNLIHAGSAVRGHEHENRNPNVPDRTSDDEDLIPH